MRKALVVMTFALGLSGQALAQSADPLRAGIERRVSAGIAVPFGPRGRTETPQLQLRGTTIRHGDAEFALSERFRWQPQREHTTRLAFTLERSPRFTIDGRELAASDDQRGISTLGYVAIGVGVAAIVGGLLFVDAVRDSSD